MNDDIALLPEGLWAGTEASLEVARAFYARLNADISASVRAGSVLEQNVRAEQVPYKLTMHDNIAVISIRGSLVNSDSPWLRYYEGVTSYHAIREALIYAVTKPEIKGVLLDVDSGGGVVNGAEDVAALVAQVDKVKPVWAYTGGSMASAAYWTAASARKIFASNISVLGSIGTVMTHIERSKHLKDNGIGVTVIRSGQFKGIATEYEPLSDVAKKQLQEMVSAIYDVFIERVADARGVTKAVANERMGQGREFVGADAVQAGLADDVLSFDKVMSKFSTLLDKASNSTQNLTHSPKGLPTMTRQALTDQQIAAIQAGAPLAEGGAPAAADPNAVAAAAAAAAVAAAAATPPAATPPVTAPAVTAAAAPADVVALLTGQVVAKDAALLTVNVELAALKARNVSLEASLAALAPIAQGSVRTMKIALGQAVGDLTALTPEQVVAEHTSVKAAFEAHFKPGGVAASAAVEAAKKPEVKGARAGVSPLDLAKATRIQPSK